MSVETLVDDVPEGVPLPPVIPLDPEVEELWSSRALLLVLLLLILSFWVSYYLKVRRIKSVHETLVALVAGAFVGLIVRLSPGTVVQGMISFKNTILLNVLLPPIILNSGFELRQANFFRNFGVILVFAFAGTLISAVALGVLVYIWALLGLEGLSLTIVECLIFGSTLSATDPVTILAIFNALKVDPKLYSIIFGESILNDAVAIVMFETLSQFHGEKVHILSFFHGVGIFLLIFLTSMALGVIFGLACSLMLKHSRLNEYPEIESCLIILIAYTSYFFSNGLTMSGIVSLLFCGITLKHYAYHNMSKRSQRTSKYIFASLAQLCENFIFIYLGLSLFTQEDLVYKPMFIFVTALAVVAARWLAVFPLAKVINVVFRTRGQRSEELPQSYQVMLFWAGLRGAVGVALAAGIKGHNAKSLRTTVLVTVVITLVVFGGTVGKMIEIVGIRTGVQEDDDDESSDEEGPAPQIGGSTYRAAATADSPYRDTYRNESTLSLHSAGAKRFGAGALYRRSSNDGLDSDEDDPEVLPSATSSNGAFGDPADSGAEAGAVWRDGQWFNVLDEQYLLPVFSNATASRRQASRKALRSSARLASISGGNFGPGGNDSYDASPEKDLGSGRSPDHSGRSSPDDTTGGDTSAAGGSNSRGFVSPAPFARSSSSHRATPSLGQAISSLFSLTPTDSPIYSAGSSSPSASTSLSVHPSIVGSSDPAQRGGFVAGGRNGLGQRPARLTNPSFAGGRDFQLGHPPNASNHRPPTSNAGTRLDTIPPSPGPQNLSFNPFSTSSFLSSGPKRRDSGDATGSYGQSATSRDLSSTAAVRGHATELDQYPLAGSQDSFTPANPNLAPSASSPTRRHSGSTSAHGNVDAMSRTTGTSAIAGSTGGGGAGVAGLVAAREEPRTQLFRRQSTPMSEQPRSQSSLGRVEGADALSSTMTSGIPASGQSTPAARGHRNSLSVGNGVNGSPSRLGRESGARPLSGSGYFLGGGPRERDRDGKEARDD